MSSYDKLDDVYTMHVLCLAAKSISVMQRKYPDMLPEELLLIAMTSLMCEEEDYPMGSARQEVLEFAMEHMRHVYGNETVTIDVESWRNIEKLSSSIRQIASKI
jgi:hypothetical protein